jgi:hypothetical protein
MSTKLTTRDYEILQHLLRYKVASREMFHRALFSKVSLNAVTKVVTRLVANGWLKRHPFLVASCYFSLTDKAARFLGTPQAAIEKALPQREIIAEYAIGAYCCLGEKLRKRLTLEEVEQDYPQLFFNPTDSANYYLDTTFRPELVGQVFVEEGASPQSFLEACRQDIATRSKRAAFRKLVVGGGFRMTILTAVPEKAIVLKAAVKKIDWPEGLRTEVIVVPGLMNAVANLGTSSADASSPRSSERAASNGHDGSHRMQGSRSGIRR